MAMAKQKEIIDARKDEEGRIAEVKFAGNQNFTPLETAIRMAERNEIKNHHVMHRKDGTEWLRSNPNAVKEDNLKELAKKS